MPELDIPGTAPTWLDAFDWYHDEFRDCFVYFDSWAELKKLAGSYNIAAQQVKIEAFMRKHTAKTLTQWSDLLLA